MTRKNPRVSYDEAFAILRDEYELLLRTISTVLSSAFKGAVQRVGAAHVRYDGEIPGYVIKRLPLCP